MTLQKQEVYRYYKNRYPNFIVLFRIGDIYEAYADDAAKVSSITGYLIFTDQDNFDILSFPKSFLQYFVEKISDSELGIKIVSYVGENGKYALPDIKKLEENRRNDY
jgi:DNA mismatch repair ATPase MutS